MKIAIYIEDGLTQVVLTPEAEFEKLALKGLHGGHRTIKVFEGNFYPCRGGFVTQDSEPVCTILKIVPTSPVGGTEA